MFRRPGIQICQAGFSSGPGGWHHNHREEGEGGGGEGSGDNNHEDHVHDDDNEEGEGEKEGEFLRTMLISANSSSEVEWKAHAL